MFRIAEKQAKKSLYLRARIGAVITNKHCVISSACNSVRGYKTPRGFSEEDFPRRWKDSLHAEQAAILKALNSGKQADLVGSTLFVTRIKKDGSKGLAKPCKTCSELILSVGIKRVFYTTEVGADSYEPVDG